MLFRLKDKHAPTPHDGPDTGKKGHRLSACETSSFLLNTRETPHLLRPARVGIKSAVGSLDFLRVSPLGPFRRGLLLWPGYVSKKTCQLTSATSCDCRRKVPDVGWCQRFDDGLGTSKFSFSGPRGKPGLKTTSYEGVVPGKTYTATHTYSSAVAEERGRQNLTDFREEQARWFHMICPCPSKASKVPFRKYRRAVLGEAVFQLNK